MHQIRYICWPILRKHVDVLSIAQHSIDDFSSPSQMQDFGDGSVQLQERSAWQPDARAMVVESNSVSDETSA